MQRLPPATNRGGNGGANPDNKGIVNMRFIPSSALYILTALTAAALLLFTLLANADHAGAQTPLGGDTATSTSSPDFATQLLESMTPQAVGEEPPIPKNHLDDDLAELTECLVEPVDLGVEDPTKGMEVQLKAVAKLVSGKQFQALQQSRYLNVVFAVYRDDVGMHEYISDTAQVYQNLKIKPRGELSATYWTVTDTFVPDATGAYELHCVLVGRLTGLPLQPPYDLEHAGYTIVEVLTHPNKSGFIFGLTFEILKVWINSLNLTLQDTSKVDFIVWSELAEPPPIGEPPTPTPTYTPSPTPTATPTITPTATPVPIGGCNNGIVVPNPGNNPDLVQDCAALISAAPTLGGRTITPLNWSINTSIGNWEGNPRRQVPPKGS